MLPSSSLRSMENAVFGYPSPFPQNILPTHSDVLKRILLSKESLVTETGRSKPSIREIVKPIVPELEQIWRKASLPTLSEDSIRRNLEQAYEMGKKAERNLKEYDGKEKLFDICACRCPQETCEKVGCVVDDCSEIHIVHSKVFFSRCTVSIERKELPFLMDQRGKREMFVGGIHKKDTMFLQRKAERQELKEKKEEKEEKRVDEETKNQKEANATFFSEAVSSSDGWDGKRKESDVDWIPEGTIVKVKQRNMHTLENTALACDRTGTSSRSAALLCNSYALDMGWLTPENRLTDTLDKRKLDRWRAKERKRINEREEKEISSRPVQAVYLDGKKLATLVKVKGKSGKEFQKTVIQDHYVTIEDS